jgi:hypothetical protein
MFVVVIMRMIMKVVPAVVMSFLRLNMDMRMIVARMAMPYRDPALRGGMRVDQQKFRGPRRAKYRGPSNVSFAKYPHRDACRCAGSSPIVSADRSSVNQGRSLSGIS